MTRIKRYAVVLVAGVAIGLLWTQAAWAQPGPADRPHDGAVAQPHPNAPPGDAAMDDPPGPPDNPPGDRPPPRPDGKQNPGDGGPGGMRGPAMGGGSGKPDGMPLGPGMPGGLPLGPGMPNGMLPPPGMMPGGMFDMQRRDPEMFKLMREDLELEQQSRALATEYQHASKENREKLKQQIVELVNKQFDVRQQRRTLELKRLEDELKRLRDMLERRTKARKELIEKRVSELVGPEESGVEF